MENIKTSTSARQNVKSTNICLEAKKGQHSVHSQHPAVIKRLNIKSVEGFYNDMFDSNPKRVNFETIQTKYISNLLQNCDINKATGIDNLSGRFLKDGADILTMPTIQIFSISIKLSHFPKDCKVARQSKTS